MRPAVLTVSRAAARLAVAAILLGGGAGAAPAQSLAELAKKEKARREAVKKQDATGRKTYTNDDLGAAGDRRGAGGARAEGGDAEVEASTGAATPEVQDTGSRPAAGEARPAAGDVERELERERFERETLELGWRARFAEARAAVAEAEARSWQTVVRTEFVNGIPVQVQVREQVETEELRQARRRIPELEEELRRAGLPPGWGRE